MTRDNLHELVERIPDDQLFAAERILEYFATNPAYRAAWSAPPDEEPVTESEVAAIARAREDLSTGQVVRHDDILREFGLS